MELKIHAMVEEVSATIFEGDVANGVCVKRSLPSPERCWRAAPAVTEEEGTGSEH